jgi:hypothetical protein
MKVALPPGAVIWSINALYCDCDCGLDHEMMIRVRCYVLVAAFASHLVLLSVIVNHRSPRQKSTTLKLNPTTMIRIQIQSLDQIEMHLMTWQAINATFVSQPKKP